MFLFFSVSLIGVDVGNTSTRMSRFANYLRNLLPSNDVVVMEMAAKAVGILALASGTYAAEYVEFEVKRALEWLTGDRIEGRRQAAVGGDCTVCSDVINPFIYIYSMDAKLGTMNNNRDKMNYYLDLIL